MSAVVLAYGCANSSAQASPMSQGSMAPGSHVISFRSRPYRALFPSAQFYRADYVAFDEVDYLLPYDSIIPERENAFDLVISTQVAEHLPVPQTYFREALRVLKPGGQLICTTHGCWEDHGVPFDFQRWTGDGLRRDLEHAGFGVEGIFKITSSHRCHVFFLIYWLSHFNCGSAVAERIFSRGVRSLTATMRPLLHTLLDALCGSSRVVGGEDLPKHRFYSVIAAVARKNFDPTRRDST
jgi:SAM-dependent methyltransferase